MPSNIASITEGRRMLVEKDFQYSTYIKSNLFNVVTSCSFLFRFRPKVLVLSKSGGKEKGQKKQIMMKHLRRCVIFMMLCVLMFPKQLMKRKNIGKY